MAKIDGGEMVVRMLRQEGITTLFVLHGGHLDSLLQVAVRHEMRLVDTRHEQAAGHAADGWARTTGQTGVAVVTADLGGLTRLVGLTHRPSRWSWPPRDRRSCALSTRSVRPSSSVPLS